MSQIVIKDKNKFKEDLTKMMRSLETSVGVKYFSTFCSHLEEDNFVEALKIAKDIFNLKEYNLFCCWFSQEYPELINDEGIKELIAPIFRPNSEPAILKIEDIENSFDLNYIKLKTDTLILTEDEAHFFFTNLSFKNLEFFHLICPGSTLSSLIDLEKTGVVSITCVDSVDEVIKFRVIDSGYSEDEPVLSVRTINLEQLKDLVKLNLGVFNKYPNLREVKLPVRNSDLHLAIRNGSGKFTNTNLKLIAKEGLKVSAWKSDIELVQKLVVIE